MYFIMVKYNVEKRENVLEAKGLTIRMTKFRVYSAVCRASSPSLMFHA